MKTAIYHIRTRCNYSQSMAARELGVSRQMFSAWECGDKPVPEGRKKGLAALFGVPAAMLEEGDEGKVLAFCDRPVFSTDCRGKQVFSFLPPEDRPRVFLGGPTETRPEERCRALMAQKAELLGRLDRLLRFTPRRQVDELPDMEEKIALLSCFAGLAEGAEAVEPRYRGRLLAFLLEQLELLRAMVGGGEPSEGDGWGEQQLHLLRLRWGEANTRPEDGGADGAPPGEDCPPEDILREIGRWYQLAKGAGADRAELQWRLNQMLEQEREHELDRTAY